MSKQAEDIKKYVSKGDLAEIKDSVGDTYTINPGELNFEERDDIRRIAMLHDEECGVVDTISERDGMDKIRLFATVKFLIDDRKVDTSTSLRDTMRRFKRSQELELTALWIAAWLGKDFNDEKKRLAALNDGVEEDAPVEVPGE